MAQNKTKYMRKLVLDHFLGRVNSPFPSERWLALFSDDPTDEGRLTDELTQAGYARVPIVSRLSDAILASGLISNSAQIAFAAAAEDWPEVTHAGIMDAATAGNMLYFGPAVTSRVVENGDQFKIQPGQLTIIER